MMRYFHLSTANGLNNRYSFSPQPTTMNQFRAEGLKPYLEYELDVSALNEFTMLNQPLVFDPGFGRDAVVRTLEGGMLVCVCVCVCVCVF